MRIDQVMSQPVITCRASDTLEAAAGLMWEHDVGAIAVVDDDDKLVGMITDRDIAMCAYTQGAQLRDVEISRAMAREVFGCAAKDDVEDVARLMSAKQIRRVPVVDTRQRPIGLVSINDLVREAASDRKPRFEKEVVHAMAAVCEPRRHQLERRPAASERPTPHRATM